MQVQVARSSLFTAQVVARDMIAAGREKEIEEIRKFISSIVPDLKAEPLLAESPEKQVQSTENSDSQA